MPNLFSKLLMFTSSYSPMWVLLALQLGGDHPTAAVVFVAVSVVAIGGLIALLRQSRQISGTRLTVKSSYSRNSDVMSYLVTYILPFLSLNFEKLTEAVSGAILIAVVAIIYVNSNMIYVNPILSLLGYHVLEITDSNDKIWALITKRDYLAPQQQIMVAEMGPYLAQEKRSA